jgi:hypothetical protein
MRFVYAVEKHRLPGLLRAFNATGARHLLVGVRLWPESTTWGRYLRWYLWNSESRRPRLRRRFNRYIPAEQTLHRLLKDAGWEILDRKSLHEPRPLGRYIYLLRTAS